MVTHLPQVAAYADRHVVVEKARDGSVTSSGLTVLDDAQRERELSRMLAGLADSDTALAHARELLEVAQEARRGLTTRPAPGCADRSDVWHDGLSHEVIGSRNAPCRRTSRDGPGPRGSNAAPATCCRGCAPATSR